MKKIDFDINKILSKGGGFKSLVKIEGDKVYLSSKALTYYDVETHQMYKGFENFTKEVFIKFGVEFFQNVSVNFQRYMDIMKHYTIYNNVVSMLENAEKNEDMISKTAKKKYSKEFYIKKFIEDTLFSKNFGDLMGIDSYHFNTLKEWNFDSGFGLSQCSTRFEFMDFESEEGLEYLKKTLSRIYDSISTDAIMLDAEEMMFHFTITGKNYLQFCWPTLEFKFNDNGKQKVKNNQETLTNAIREFYSTTTYFGD